MRLDFNRLINKVKKQKLVWITDYRGTELEEIAKIETTVKNFIITSQDNFVRGLLRTRPRGSKFWLVILLQVKTAYW